MSCQKEREENHYCHLCQYFTSRKEDLESHLGYKHKIGKMFFHYVGKNRNPDGSGTQKSSQKLEPTHKNTTQVYSCILVRCWTVILRHSEGILKTHMVKAHEEEKEKDYLS